ncbi:hypothetical protein HYN48_07315 [Flavobacterium magnum]|uniref:Nucleoside phosphorylase domain-containing protein n=1 Tax=Flavobacterium magnum TaxID=2162713 RepID=A0A2S0RGQ4_9FLAO|nr:hypothetical protein [Flavobacterium magnum]AWA29902.1 hypothetical protein HYN48_07315 [Flavobacterium magnum]
MGIELEFFPTAVPYFRKFVESNMPDFLIHMREYRTYPQGGYGSFYRDNEVIQVLINIYHNIDETFGDLLIPQTFASPKSLAKAWESFYIFLKNDDKLFDDIYSKLSPENSDDEDYFFPVILTSIDQDRKKVIEMLEFILALGEVAKFLKNPAVDIDEKKIEFKAVPQRVFDVVIITAIIKEYLAVVELLNNGFTPNFHDPSRTTYFQGIFTLESGAEIKVLVVCSNQMGMTSAASLASKVISRFTPKLVAMCGIAAGISGNIGDVMIPDILWDYGSGKSSLEAEETTVLFWKRTKIVEKFSPYRFPITIQQQLIGALIRLTKQSLINDTVYKLGSHLKFDGKAEKIRAHIGPFVSGSAVIANDKLLEQIKNQDGKLIGFDMEAFAIAYAASVSDITPQPIAFIIKSISDFGNMKKSHMEKDKHQEYAAFTSANYLHQLIIKNGSLFNLE